MERGTITGGAVLVTRHGARCHTGSPHPPDQDPAEVNDVEVVIDPTERSQTLLGYGGAFTEASLSEVLRSEVRIGALTVAEFLLSGQRRELRAAR